MEEALQPAGGSTLKDYVLGKRLAAGGMGEVFLAMPANASDTRQLVVIKRLLAQLSWEPEFVAMFLREVRVAKALVHPNIVRVCDFGVDEGGHFLVMEYLHGKTVRELLRATGGPLALPQVAAIMHAVAAGLDYAHNFPAEDGETLEVVHRDIAPSNLIVTFEGQLKIIDFGIARVADYSRNTRTGTIRGKIGYMAPEQCRGEDVDRRADVFALGVVLYELCTGRRAFTGPSEVAVISRVLAGTHAPLRSHRPDLPPSLEAVTERALALRPEDRFDDVPALVRALSEAVPDPGPEARRAELKALMTTAFGDVPWPKVERPAPVAQAPASSGSRSTLRSFAIAVGAAALATAATIGVYTSQTPKVATASPKLFVSGLPAMEPMAVAEMDVAPPEPEPPAERAAPQADEPQPEASPKATAKKKPRKARRHSTRNRKSEPDRSHRDLLPPSWHP